MKKAIAALVVLVITAGLFAGYVFGEATKTLDIFAEPASLFEQRSDVTMSTLHHAGFREVGAPSEVADVRFARKGSALMMQYTLDRLTWTLTAMKAAPDDVPYPDGYILMNSREKNGVSESQIVWADAKDPARYHMVFSVFYAGTGNLYLIHSDDLVLTAGKLNLTQKPTCVLTVQEKNTPAPAADYSAPAKGYSAPVPAKAEPAVCYHANAAYTDYIRDCTEGATRRWVCWSCGKTWDETLPGKAHTYVKIGEDRRGAIEFQCAVCSDIYWDFTSAYEWEDTPHCDNHDYREFSHVEPTCTECGYREWICGFCLDTWYDLILPPGHDYRFACTAETGEEIYICARCGDVTCDPFPEDEEEQNTEGDGWNSEDGNESGEEDFVPEETEGDENWGEYIPDETRDDENQDEYIPDETQDDENQDEFIPDETQDNENQDEFIPDETQDNENQDEYIPDETQDNEDQSVFIPDDAWDDGNQDEYILDDTWDDGNW